DKSYADKKIALESKVKQVSGLLRGVAKKEGLPFDQSLIDKPENAVVSLSGQVVAVGDCYEIKNQFESSAIIKITAVDIKEKGFKYESIISNLYRNQLKRKPNDWELFDINSLLDLKPIKVSYSEKGLSLKKLLAQDIKYSHLIDGTIDKGTFNEHYREINFDKYV
ncbi:MAG: hypothetical protein HQK79_23150, partial [Desulfobacterales bacterium]|nr:hypothetical protein [Desulfobacterales bacterium]